MKKMNKKGFTIVELVIVIAVIAILSAVMIPTFSGMISEANESAAYQEAVNIYKAYRVDNYAEPANGAYVAVSTDEDDADYEYYFVIADGVVSDEATPVATVEAGARTIITGSSDGATTTVVPAPAVDPEG